MFSENGVIHLEARPICYLVHCILNLSDPQVITIMSDLYIPKKKKARRGNASRYQLLRKSLIKYNRFYPIYIGYSHADTPVFDHPSCALTWQLSRYLRDHVKTAEYSFPDWLHWVGTFHSDQCPVILSSLNEFSNSASIIESNFYKNVKFYKISTNARVVSGHGRTTDNIFDLCTSTLKDSCDYMSSSHSIYKKNQSCINHPSELIVSSEPTIGNSKKENGIYEVGHSLKKYLRVEEFARYGKFD